MHKLHKYNIFTKTLTACLIAETADVLVAHLGSNFLKIQLVQLLATMTYYAVQIHRIPPDKKCGDSEKVSKSQSTGLCDLFFVDK